jgi:hypothetical protein
MGPGCRALLLAWRRDQLNLVRVLSPAANAPRGVSNRGGYESGADEAHHAGVVW